MKQHHTRLKHLHILANNNCGNLWIVMNRKPTCLGMAIDEIDQTSLMWRLYIIKKNVMELIWSLQYHHFSIISKIDIVIVITITYKNYPQPNPSEPKYYKPQITHQIWNQIFIKRNNMKTLWSPHNITMSQLFREKKQLLPKYILSHIIPPHIKLFKR